jgi:hypothetical protein
MTDTVSTESSWQLEQAADPGYISWIAELELGYSMVTLDQTESML